MAFRHIDVGNNKIRDEQGYVFSQISILERWVVNYSSAKNGASYSPPIEPIGNCEQI